MHSDIKSILCNQTAYLSACKKWHHFKLPSMLVFLSSLKEKKTPVLANSTCQKINYKPVLGMISL